LDAWEKLRFLACCRPSKKSPLVMALRVCFYSKALAAHEEFPEFLERRLTRRVNLHVFLQSVEWASKSTGN